MSGLASLMHTFGGTVDVYRSPAAVAGKTGTPTLYAANVRALIGPASDMQRVGLAPQGLGGGRAEYVCFLLPSETRVQLGDELRDGTLRYAVLSPPANWYLGKAAELSRPISASAQAAGGGSASPWFDYSQRNDLNYIYHLLY